MLVNSEVSNENVSNETRLIAHNRLYGELSDIKFTYLSDRDKSQVFSTITCLIMYFIYLIVMFAAAPLIARGVKGCVPIIFDYFREPIPESITLKDKFFYGARYLLVDIPTEERIGNWVMQQVDSYFFSFFAGLPVMGAIVKQLLTKNNQDRILASQTVKFDPMQLLAFKNGENNLKLQCRGENIHITLEPTQTEAAPKPTV